LEHQSISASSLDDIRPSVRIALQTSASVSSNSSSTKAQMRLNQQQAINIDADYSGSRATPLSAADAGRAKKLG
jgi:hypothetical protein